MSKRPNPPGLPSPGMMLPPKSALLSRVGAFLPQIQAANKDLEGLSDQQAVRVDLQLKPDVEEQSEDDSSSSNSGDDEEGEEEFLIRERQPAKKKAKEEEEIKNDEGGKTKGTSSPPQQIELKLALGKLNDPVMNLLGSSEEEPPTSSAKEDNEEDSEPSSLLKVVGTKQKKSGPLITELS